MRILLFGRDGQLGRELHRLLLPFEGVASLDKEEADFTDLGEVSKVIQRGDPRLIINAAAYTPVDRAESEAELAYQLNSYAPRMIATEAEKIGAMFIHFSTDFVFDGKKGEAYVESDTPNPVSTYGLSKLEGETAVLDRCERSIILRTSWLYGDRRTSFPWKVLHWAHTQKVVEPKFSKKNCNSC
jgi:dTDP-4-dehydrorhamnose reductase